MRENKITDFNMKDSKTKHSGKTILSLFLLVPVSSVGIVASMILCPNSLLGAAIFALSKLYLLVFPLLWYKGFDKEAIRCPGPPRDGLGVGIFSGIVMSLGILCVYQMIGTKLIDDGLMIQRIQGVGIATKPRYIACALYWILINSILEEYVWRWFVVRQVASLMNPYLAVLCSAAFYTLHHTVALQVYFSPATVIICSVGVFCGGAVFSSLYMKYHSIWPGYICHAIIDACILGIGAWIVFGPN